MLIESEVSCRVGQVELELRGEELVGLVEKCLLRAMRIRGDVIVCGSWSMKLSVDRNKGSQ